MRPVDTAAAPAYTPREALLKNRPARSGSRHVHGRSAIALGALLVVAVAGTLGLKADEIIAAGLAYRNPGWWFRVNIVAGVTIAGIALLVGGVRDLRRRARLERRRAANPRQAWQWDYEWDERGIHDDDALRRARELTAWAAGVLAYAVPMHAAVIAAIPRARASIVSLVLVWLPLWVGIAFCDVLALVLIGKASKLVRRRLEYGRPWASFARFPFRVGQHVELHVRAPRSLPQHAATTATLRCIQERYVTTETAKGETQTNTQCFELYRDTAPAEPVATDTGTGVLRVRFAIPADAPTSDLASRPCRYWEVEVEAATDGVDYGVRFLVPVY